MNLDKTKINPGNILDENPEVLVRAARIALENADYDEALKNVSRAEVLAKDNRRLITECKRIRNQIPAPDPRRLLEDARNFCRAEKYDDAEKKLADAIKYSADEPALSPECAAVTNEIKHGRARGIIREAENYCNAAMYDDAEGKIKTARHYAGDDEALSRRCEELLDKINVGRARQLIPKAEKEFQAGKYRSGLVTLGDAANYARNNPQVYSECRTLAGKMIKAECDDITDGAQNVFAAGKYNQALTECRRARQWVNSNAGWIDDVDGMIAGALFKEGNILLARAEAHYGNRNFAAALADIAAAEGIFANDPEKLSACKSLRRKTNFKQKFYFGPPAWLAIVAAVAGLFFICNAILDAVKSPEETKPTTATATVDDKKQTPPSNKNAKSNAPQPVAKPADKPTSKPVPKPGNQPKGSGANFAPAKRTGTDIYVGNYKDGTKVYILSETVSIKSRTPYTFECTVKAGNDYLRYSFYPKNGSPYYKNSEGYEGFAKGGASPVASEIYSYVVGHW